MNEEQPPMLDDTEQVIEDLVKQKKVRPVDLLANLYGGNTRAERRAFKSRLLNLARREARAAARRKA